MTESARAVVADHFGILPVVPVPVTAAPVELQAVPVPVDVRTWPFVPAEFDES